jgi:hypothetical protein
MRKIKWQLSIGLAGATQEGEFEVDDNTPDHEIEEMAKEEVFSYIDWGWDVKSEGDDVE